MTTSRTKRTYNLSASTVATVKELAGEYRIASSQDAVIEMAVERLARSVRDERHAAAWADAARDPEFVRENEQLAREFAAAERDAWAD